MADIVELPSKYAWERPGYKLDWSGILPDEVTIASVAHEVHDASDADPDNPTWLGATMVKAEDFDNDTRITEVDIEGGTADHSYIVRARVTGTDGQKYQQNAVFFVDKEV